MSKTTAKKGPFAGDKAAKKARKDHRTNVINLIIAVVFVVGVLALLGYSQGVYLPLVTALSADGQTMDAVTFNYYYRDCYDSFQSAYGEMLDAYGTLDSRKSLDRQEYSVGYTWAQFFYDAAVRNAKRSMLSYMAAGADGYALDADGIADVDRQIEELKAAAQRNGFSTAAGLLRAHYGKGATVKSYREYLLMDATANGYSGQKFQSVSCSAQEMEAWFSENHPDAGSEYDYNTVNFRMIYFPYSGYAYDETTGIYDFSAEAKAAAMNKLRTASTVYVQGEQTEEAFAAVAAQYSSYKPAEGGLYENATKNDDGVEAQVRAWIFEKSRYPGEVNYVEADSGVYLVYWIGEGISAREYEAQKGIRNDAWNAWFETLAAGTEIEENPNIMKHLYYAV